MKIENLVFKGGGVKGSAYAGCVKFLEEKNLLKDIIRVAGTSAGAILAFLLAIGCNSKEIEDILKKLDFKSFKSGFNPLRIFTTYGLYSGDNFIKWLEGIMESKNLPSSLTFAGLKVLRKVESDSYKELYVFATSLNRETIQGFSAERTPNVKIVDAVRASMSIPLFFKSWQIKQFPGEIFVDGGLAYNYPMSVFDNEQFLLADEEVNPRTLGFYIGTFDKKEKNNQLTTSEITKYISILFSTLLDVEVINIKNRHSDVERTVFIPDLNVSAIDFDLTKSKIKDLYNSGYNATLEYFKNL